MVALRCALGAAFVAFSVKSAAGTRGPSSSGLAVEAVAGWNVNAATFERSYRSDDAAWRRSSLIPSVDEVVDWGVGGFRSIDAAARATHSDVCDWADRRARAVREAATELSAAVGGAALAAGERAGLVGRRGQQLAGTGGSRYNPRDIARVTDHVVQSVVDVVRADGWEHVTTSQGVTVWRNLLAVAGGGADGPQFACIKAAAVIDAPVDVVYRLFADNDRVHEYNEHCRELCDLEVLDSRTKITWAASGRMGPFKARDFCSLVHIRRLGDGTLAQVSRPARHRAAPCTDRYVRSEVLLAGNFMRPLPSDSSKTEFLSLTHLNPGGAAESRAGAMLVNNLAVNGPVTFVRRLEVAAQRLLEEEQRDGRRSGGSGRSSGFGRMPVQQLYEDREVTRSLPVV